MRYVQLAALALALGACSNADRSAIGAYGHKHRVTLYSGGRAVGAWTTTGMPENEEHSDGFYFQAIESGRVVHVSGTTVIEALP